jgi:hypothetical protein
MSRDVKGTRPHDAKEPRFVKHIMIPIRRPHALLVFVIAALAGIGLTAAGQRAVSPNTAPRIDAESVRAAQGLDQMLPAHATAIYRALSTRFQPQRAMDVVTFMDRFWRVAGNPGFNASLDYIKAGLVDAGFRDGRTAGTASSTLWVEEYPNGGNGWELRRAEMTIVSAANVLPSSSTATKMIALVMSG